MLFRHHGGTLSVWTPAKLNLFLEILGKRADGYHELETVMVTVGVFDTLYFTETDTDEICLTCHDTTSNGSEQNLLTLGDDNLVVRAAKLLCRYIGDQRGVNIHLTKRIPVAAGLAGGSSDAAATLEALNRFWKLNLTSRELRDLAAQLGSDISFFIGNTRAAICHGRGEKVTPLSIPAGLHFVVVRPQSGLSTADVFRGCLASDQPFSADNLVSSLKKGNLGEAARYFYNALQKRAEHLNPDVTHLRERFSAQTVLGHMMSGSGTAYFGLCANRFQAQAVAARLRAMRLGQVHVASSGR